MFTRVIGFAALCLLIGCGTKPGDPISATDQPAGQSVAAVPSGFDSRKAATSKTKPPGTAIRVRLDETMDTRHNRPGDAFTATLAEPVGWHEKTLLPKGTTFQGHVARSAESGRLKGRAVLPLTLDSFELNGKTYKIDTSVDSRPSAG